MSEGAASSGLAGRKTPEPEDAAAGELPRVAPGTVIGGRFVVEGLLGSGGMGVVVLARHRELGELRAIKLLRSDRVPNAAARRRLLREARAAARIGSAHVVRVFDVVTDDPTCPYVVMEHLVGETLAARLVRGILDVAQAARVVVEACEALAEAHQNGTVHRDLKPSNLFLTASDGRDDFVKILDFGIAKTEEARFGGDWTHSRALLATPAYASPEQLRASRDVDPRSDIWSLGVIIHQCLTGRLPFEGGTLAETSSRILRDDPPPMRALHPGLPEALERVVARCLEKRREARFTDVQALVEALSPFAPAAAAVCLDRVRALPSPTAAAASPPQLASPPGALEETLSQSSVGGVASRETDVSRRMGERARALAPVALLGATAAVVIALGVVTWLGKTRPSAAASPVAPPVSSAPTPPPPSAPARVVAEPFAPPSAAGSIPAAANGPTAGVSPASPARETRDAGRDRHARVRRPPGPRSGATARSITPARPPAAPTAASGAAPLAPVDELRLDELIDERK